MSPSFETIFGIPASAVRDTCVLLPVLSKGMMKAFKIPSLEKGKPFASGSNESLTVIFTQMGASCVGDAVLMLEESPCKNLILFGSCGAVRKTSAIDLGRLVACPQSFDYSHFSGLLSKTCEHPKAYQASHALIQAIQTLGDETAISMVNGATFGSLFLENNYQETLTQNNIAVLDMECSAFYHAASHIRREAVGIFYVTDILKEKHVFSPQPSLDYNLFQKAIDNAATIIESLSR